MIRLGLIRVALLQGFGDTQGDGPSQGLIRIPPNQTVMLSIGADDSLRILIYSGTVMFFHRILVLGFHVVTTDFDSIQFVAPNAPVQNFLTSCGSVEEPSSISLDDGDRQWPIVVSDNKSGAVRVLGIYDNRILLVSFCSKGNSDVLVSNGVLRSDQVFTTWTENLVESGHIKVSRSLNERVGGFFRGRESLLVL